MYRFPVGRIVMRLSVGKTVPSFFHCISGAGLEKGGSQRRTTVAPMEAFMEEGDWTKCVAIPVCVCVCVCVCV